MNEKETKYAFHPRHRAILAQWLDSYTQVESVYPENVVSSIYYDTPGMDGLYEKINSDYAKSKFRIRWYMDPATQSYGAVFAETKRKSGSTRMKERIPIGLSPRELDAMWLDDPRLVEIPRSLSKSDVRIGADLRPVIQISYRRRRYVHQFSGTRLNLDWDICPVKVSPWYSTMLDPSPLDVIVFEVKGSETRLPAPLIELMAMNGRREAYSKYYECCLSATRQDRH